MEKTLEKLCEEAISICVHTRCNHCEYGGRTLRPSEGQRCQGKLLADYLRKHGVAMQRWIPVEERLPALIPCNAGTAYSDAVNVLTSGRKVLTAIWDGTDFIADAGFWEAEDEEITYWTPVLLPLPGMPKAECKHEFVYDEQLGESVCVKCGHVLTKEEKRYALEYAMALMRSEEGQ